MISLCQKLSLLSSPPVSTSATPVYPHLPMITLLSGVIKKKSHKKWKKSKRVRGSAPKMKKSKIQKGGIQIFKFSPNLNEDFKCFS